jgi:hypothetical protein
VLGDEAPLQQRAVLVVRCELAHARHAGVIGAVDAVEAIGVLATALASVVAAQLAGVAAVRARAVEATSAAFAHAFRVAAALDVLRAARCRIAGRARVAHARHTEATPFGTRVVGAIDGVVAVGGGAAQPARRAVGTGAALLAFGAARRLATGAAATHADGAGIIVGVALLIGATLGGAARARAA